MKPEGSLPHSQEPTTCPYPEPDQSSPSPPPPTHFHQIHLHIILPPTPGSFQWPLSLRFPRQNPVCTTPLTHTCYIPRSTHSSSILGEKYRTSSSSLGSFLHSPVTSSLLGPNILLSTLFSNILNLRFCLNVSDQVSLPYKTTGKIIALYISHIAEKKNCPWPL